MKKLGVQPLQCLMEQGVAGRSGEPEVLKELGVEVDPGNKVAISQTRVELECQKNKESGKRKLDRATIAGSGVWNGIAKADKLIKEKVIPASLGRII